MKISLVNNEVKEELLDTTAYKYEERANIKDLIMVLPRSDKLDSMSIYIHLNEDPTDTEEHYNDLLLDFINFQLDLNLSSFQDMRDLVDAVHILYMYFEKFSVKMNCRNVYAFQRLPPELLDIELNLGDERPIPKGIFKGTYGSHGNEIISLSYPNPDKLEGIKLTGDPNVPMDKTSFYAGVYITEISSLCKF